MKRLSLFTLFFSIVFTIFFLLLIFFRTPFPSYPLMSWQDAIDVLTCLVLLPFFWILFKYCARGEASLSDEIAFVILGAAWVFGHGMHLSANSIDNLIEGLAKKQVLDITGTDIYTLTYFFDEQLSHYLRELGFLGLVALLSIREWRQPAGQATAWWAAIIGGFIHGFTYFCVFLEGQTTLLGFPFAIVFTLVTLIWGRKMLSRAPLLAFFFVALLVATIFFAGWGLYWGGFPEFSEVGLI